ncbi:MAG: hypothetical protein N2053_12835, partial [Chitinispirillaceae bacterium]|nr:hypothetical protein [Chitinispirillaceae bacterium]
MVKELVIVCPHCHHSARVFLSRDAFVIILNCPSCASPLMYFDHKIFLLTESQLEAIKKRSKKDSIFEMIDKKDDNSENSISAVAKTNKLSVNHSCRNNKLSLVKHKGKKNYFNFSEPKNSISEDDIT